LENLVKFITPGIIFVLTLASGIGLSSTAKPLNTAIFTLHKLVALGAVVITAIQIYNLLKNTTVQAILIALIILIGLSVIALFVTGALMSINPASMSYPLLLTIHRVAPFLVVIALIWAIFLLNMNTP